MNFRFEGRAKTLTYVLMGIGLVAMATGFFTDDSHGHQRFWANILVNGFFYFSLGLGALFFYALQYATESGWSAVLKRLFEAMYGFIPYGAGAIVLVLLAGQFHLHHLYHWMDQSLYFEYLLADGSLSHEMAEGAADNPNFDYIIANKGAYLNGTFFWIRTLVYIGTFLLFARLFRKWSLAEDEVGGTELH